MASSLYSGVYFFRVCLVIGHLDVLRYYPLNLVSGLIRPLQPKVLLLSHKQLQEAIKNNPFPTSDGKALHFFFLEQPCSKPNIDYLESLKIESEKFKLHKMTFYLYAPEGVGRSKLAAATGKALGVSLTARNWNTVNKLASMIEQL